MAEQSVRSNIRRSGTTADNRRSGKTDRNFANKRERAEWDKTGRLFPFKTCNGKRNKFFEKGATTPGRHV